jgi:SnoaL-like domain
MSRANLDAFEKGNDAFMRGDWDAIAATMDAHILVRADPRWPEQRFYGREAVIAFWRGLWESWGPDARVEEVTDLGDRLLVRWRFVIRGQHSGAEGEQRISAIQTYRKGQVILVEYFLEHEQALEALEMRE